MVGYVHGNGTEEENGKRIRRTRGNAFSRDIVPFRFPVFPSLAFPLPEKSHPLLSPCSRYRSKRKGRLRVGTRFAIHRIGSEPERNGMPTNPRIVDLLHNPFLFPFGTVRMDMRMRRVQKGKGSLGKTKPGTTFRDSDPSHGDPRPGALPPRSKANLSHPLGYVRHRFGSRPLRSKVLSHLPPSRSHRLRRTSFPS